MSSFLNPQEIQKPVARTKPLVEQPKKQDLAWSTKPAFQGTKPPWKGSAQEKRRKPYYKGRRYNKNRPYTYGKRPKPPKGIIHIQTTFNNTIITVTNLQGTVFFWSSSGINNFKSARKSTPYAAKVTGRKVAKKSRSQGLFRVKLNVKGTGPGRKAAIHALFDRGIRFSEIRDRTSLAHNGCRPPKKRRV